MRNGWVETTLGQYIHINTGKLDVNAASEFGEYPFFTCSRETYRINEAAFEGESVLVAGNGDLNVKYYDGEFNAYQRTYVLNSVDKKILDNRFLFLYMQTYIEYLRSETRGTVIQYLKKGQFTDAKIKLPPLPEQKRIVDLISSVDSYIEALQQQLESAKRSRNAVLHELLTAGCDDWVETTLDEIADVIMGQSPDGKSYNQEGKGLPFMQGSAEFGEHNPVPEKWCSEPKKIAEPGDLLLSVRAPVGDTNFADQRIAVGRGLSIIRANKASLTEFIRLVIQINVSELIASSGSGMFASITGKNLKEFKVNLPPFSEQKRIVEIINTIDEVLAKTVLTTKQAKELRSGLLSDLLSGEHEIPASYDKVMSAA